MTAKEHAAYVEEHGRLPMKKSKEAVLDKVHDHINERGIWIPYGEFCSHVGVMIDRLNRKNPLYEPPERKTKPAKPTLTKAGIEEFPDNVQLEIREKIIKFIAEYKSQTRRSPTDKIRNSHIKVILSGFNSKQWKQYEKRMAKSDALLNLYDEIKNESE